MSYYQHSNYFFGLGQVPPNQYQYQWSQPPYQQEFASIPATSEFTQNNPITVSPSTSDDEDVRISEPTVSPSTSDDEGVRISEPTLTSTSVKIICPGEKKADHKTFMLRDVNIQEKKSMASFKAELGSQFGESYIDRDCEFGEIRVYGLGLITTCKN